MGSFSSVNSNQSWCPFCSGNARKTIKDAQILAQLRGGECLSQNIFGAQTMLNGNVQKAIFGKRLTIISIGVRHGVHFVRERRGEQFKMRRILPELEEVTASHVKCRMHLKNLNGCAH